MLKMSLSVLIPSKILVLLETAEILRGERQYMDKTANHSHHQAPFSALSNKKP
jgi:hypothetical protein